MSLNKKPAENTLVDHHLAVRRKFLGSLLASSGAVLLAACGGGGGGSDPATSASTDAVANRARRPSYKPTSASPATSASSTSAASATTANTATTASSSTPAAAGSFQFTVQDAVAQMQMPHEAKPKGVPAGYDWAEAPIVWQSTPPAGFSAMTGWGEIQCAIGATNPIAATVQLRNFQTYVLDSSGKLSLLQNQGSLDGAEMLPDFSNNTSYPTQITNSGGVTTVGLDPTLAFQFVPSNRSSIPAGTQGVVVTVEAQLVVPAGTTAASLDNTYILALGGDWWQSMTAQWSNFTTNTGIGTGRFVYLTTSWQSFTFTSIQNASSAVLALPFTA